MAYLCEGGIVKVSEKHKALLRTRYDGTSTKAEIESVTKAIQQMSAGELDAFTKFQFKAGEVFVALMADLDSELERLGDRFPEERDPRNWTLQDWVTFDLAVFEHPYEELWRTYAKQEDNFHLVWQEVVRRLEEQ
jgi:hypothetical protein